MERNLNKRIDGRIERICPHGIGHTIYVPSRYKDIDAWWIHGCDGCCKSYKKLTEKDYNELEERTK
jgi:hypothetical protein